MKRSGSLGLASFLVACIAALGACGGERSADVGQMTAPMVHGAPIGVVGSGTWSEFGGCSAYCFYRNFFWVDLDIRNDGYEKAVGIVWTEDGWETTHTDYASYEWGPLDNGYERWGVDIEVMATAHEPGSATMELAAFVIMNGTTSWDPEGNHVVTPTPDLWVGRARVLSDIINPETEITVMTETWPVGGADVVRIVYSVNGGAWSSEPMSWAGTGVNESWLARLGRFDEGTTIRYAIEATTSSHQSVWDNNDGQDYFVTVEGGGAVEWIGNVSHWPSNGELDAGEPLWIDIEAYPAGMSALAEVRYSVDGDRGGVVDMVLDEHPWGHNDHWYAQIGPFHAGAQIRYAIQVRDRDRSCHWANNGGADYLASVNR